MAKLHTIVAWNTGAHLAGGLQMRAYLLTTTAVMALLAAMPAQAQDANWLLSPVSGDFNTAGNWSPAAVPGVPTGTGTAFSGCPISPT
jgi:hypothetical protein